MDNLQPPKYRKCNDCGRKCELEMTARCPNADYTGEYCCVKFVCKDGCEMECEECGEIAKVVYNDRFEGWIEYFECPKGHQTQPDFFEWAGYSPYEYMQRYD